MQYKVVPFPPSKNINQDLQSIIDSEITIKGEQHLITANYKLYHQKEINSNIY